MNENQKKALQVTTISDKNLLLIITKEKKMKKILITLLSVILSYSSFAAFTTLEETPVRDGRGVGLNPSSVAETETILTPSEKSIAETETILTPSEKSIAETETILTPSEKSIAETETILTPSGKSIAETETILTPSEKSIAETETILTPSEKSVAETETILFPSGKSFKVEQWLVGDKLSDEIKTAQGPVFFYSEQTGEFFGFDENTGTIFKSSAEEYKTALNHHTKDALLWLGIFATVAGVYVLF